MASSLEFNKALAAVLTAGIVASGAGVVSRMIYHPQIPEENAYKIDMAAVEQAGGEAAEEQEQAASISQLLAAASANVEQAVASGQTVAKKCAACHTFEEGGPNKIGPDLWGVVGRDIASVPDFSYSDALSEKEGTWDYEKLNEFLTSPRTWAPGTKMTFAGLDKPEDRADVILYLRSLSDSPAPLPEAGS
jgi:cytochrome c